MEPVYFIYGLVMGICIMIGYNRIRYRKTKHFDKTSKGKE